MPPETAFFALLLLLVLVFIGAGFYVGYRGNWKHSAVAVTVLQGFVVAPGLLEKLLFGGAPGIYKAIGFNLTMVWLMILGSAFGCLVAKKLSGKQIAIIHAGLAGGTFVVASILGWILRGNFFAL